MNAITIPRPAHRPSEYKPEYAKQAKNMALIGAQEPDIARLLEISVQTLYEWRKAHPEFAEAIKQGKVEADGYVAQSLYHKALGYEHKVTKVFLPAGSTEPVYATYMEDVPADTAACIWWLKNRQPQYWKDFQRTQIDVTVQDNLSPEIRGLLATLLDLASPSQTILDASAQDAVTDSSKKPTE